MPLRLRHKFVPTPNAAPGATPVFLPQGAALVDQRGFVTRAWWPWFQQIVDAIVDLMQNSGGGTPDAHHETHEPGGNDQFDSLDVSGEVKATTLKSDRSSVPAVFLNDQSQPANLRLMQIANATQNLYVWALNDAGTTVSTPLQLSRTGNAIIGNNLTVNGTGGNVALRNAANTFTQHQRMEGSGPTLKLYDTAQPTDARLFRLYNVNQELAFDAVSDNEAVQQSYPLRLTRGGDARVFRDVYEKNRPVPMGHWTDVAFAAGNFGIDSGTWNVTAGHVLVNHLSVVGKTLTWVLVMTAATMSAATSALHFIIPTPFLAAKLYDGSMPVYVTDGGGSSLGRAYVASTGEVHVVKVPGGSFTTDASVQFTLTFEVQ